jgi:hypothetical protein
LASPAGEAQRAASSAGGNTQLLSDTAVRNGKTGNLWFLGLTFSANFGLIANAAERKDQTILNIPSTISRFLLPNFYFLISSYASPN